jgi:hypothetical protein
MLPFAFDNIAASWNVESIDGNAQMRACPRDGTCEFLLGKTGSDDRDGKAGSRHRK